jgi:hypothetical protein
MTNPRVTPDRDQSSKVSLKSLVQALDKLVDDQTFPRLSLPERTVAEIQKNFTINPIVSTGVGSGASYRGNSAQRSPIGSGIANDARD